MAEASLPTLLLVAVAGATLSAILVRRMIRVAVMDVPGARSAHSAPTPRGGGVGMVAAVLLGVPCCLALLPGGWTHPLPALLLLIATAVLAAVSWLDDLRQFGPAAKFVAQCLCSALVVLAAALAAPALPAALPLAVLCGLGFCWMLLCANALNFIDGLNGLAAGVSALCGLFVALLGFALSAPLPCAAGLMLAAGLAGFLPFNVPGGRIFMGDVGSQVCGLLVGGFALLLLSSGPDPRLALCVPLLLAGILFDVVLTLARRLLAGEPLARAHRGHLYQVAARAGIAPLGVSAIHWWFALWGGLVSVWLLPGRPLAAILAVLALQVAWTALVVRRAGRAGLGRWS